MEFHLSLPEDVSRNLGIQISTLRKYVTYFSHLFSAYARRTHSCFYTVEDVEVFSRIARLGDRLSVVAPYKVNKKVPAEVENHGRENPSISKDLDRVCIRISRYFDQLGGQ
jgi:hypothetical protein